MPGDYLLSGSSKPWDAGESIGSFKRTAGGATSSTQALSARQPLNAALAVHGEIMATERTAFDDYLKGSLHRDILFRVLVWAFVAGLTTYYASRTTDFTSISHLQRVADSLAPVVNAIGVTAIVISGIALVLKDLEHVSPAHWGQSTTAGRIGGVIRRLAGDLSLWVVGALVTILSAVAFVAFDAYRTGQMTSGNFWAIFMMFFVFVLFAVIVSVLNVFVRRSQPPLSGSKGFKDFLTSAPRVVLFYAVILSFTYFIG